VGGILIQWCYYFKGKKETSKKVRGEIEKRGQKKPSKGQSQMKGAE